MARLRKLCASGSKTPFLIQIQIRAIFDKQNIAVTLVTMFLVTLQM